MSITSRNVETLPPVQDGGVGAHRVMLNNGCKRFCSDHHLSYLNTRTTSPPSQRPSLESNFAAASVLPHERMPAGTSSPSAPIFVARRHNHASCHC